MKNIIGLLGWLGVALVGAALILKFGTSNASLQDWVPRLAWTGLAVTIIYALTQWRDISRSLGSRNMRYGGTAALGVVAFVAILSAVNWLGVRHHKVWDVTSNQQFSLSDQTTKILGELKQPVVVHAFYDGGDPGGKKGLEDILSQYEYGSKNFSVEYVDAVKDPVKAKQYSVEVVPTSVFEYNGRTERATGRSESDYTGAIKKLLDAKVKKVYFALGHGEHDTEDQDQRKGYSATAAALKVDNYESAKVVIPQEGKIPDDATVLVIAGPKIDYSTQEVDAIKTYLGKGGKLLMMLDPPEKADSQPLTNLIALAKDWGIEVGTNFVLDASGVGRQIGAGPTVPIGMPAKPTHPIAEKAGVAAVLPLARSATPIDGGTNGHIAQRVLETSPRSWAESDVKGMFEGKKDPEPNPDKGDKIGPVSIIAAVSAASGGATAAPDAPKPETRVVVSGDSDFASNAALNAQGNKDWFLNIVSWLAQQENLISIRAKDPGDRRLELTADASNRIFWLTIVIIPLLLFGNGFWIYWKNRT